MNCRGLDLGEGGFGQEVCIARHLVDLGHHLLEVAGRSLDGLQPRHILLRLGCVHYVEVVEK
jgi:hypothetical protein